MIMPGGSKHDTVTHFSCWCPKNACNCYQPVDGARNMFFFTQMAPSWHFTRAEIE